MKVAILIEHLYSGGTQAQSLFLARHFNKLGHETHLITFRAGGLFAFQAEDIPHYTSLQKSKRGLNFLAPRLFKTLRGIQPDVVLCMGFEANYYAGWIQKKFPCINVVGTVRTGRGISPLYRWSLKKARTIHVNTHWWKKKLVQQGFDSEKIKVVYNPLVIDFTNVNKEFLRKQKRNLLNVPKDTCVFICVQGFRVGKNHGELIRHFSQLRDSLDWRLWLVGDGPRRRKCERLVRRLKLQERVYFAGFQKDPTPYYAGADVVVTASQRDSLPNFIIEAQAMGLPALAVDTAGVKESFQPNKTGFLVLPNQADLYVKTLKCFIEKPLLRKDMSKSAKSFALENFSQKRQAEATLEAFVNLPKMEPSSNIVISRPDRIGDVIISTACLEAIKAAIPNVNIYFIVQDYIKPLIVNDPLIEGIFTLSGDLPEEDALEQYFRKIKPFCIVHLHYNAAVGAAAENVGIPQRVGFASPQNKETLTHSIPNTKVQCLKHEAEYNFDLLSLIGILRPPSFTAQLYPEFKAKKSLEKRYPGIHQMKPFCALHLTVHGNKPTLPPELFVQVARWLRETYQFNCVLVGKETNHPSVLYFMEHLSEDWVYDALGILSLAETAWLLNKAALIVGRDSGITHLAAAMGSPTLAIVGPNAKNLAGKRWRPLGPKAHWIENNQLHPHLMERTNHYQRRYAQSITFTDVKAAIDGVLNKAQVHAMV